MTKIDSRRSQTQLLAISHILETSLYVADLDRSRDFYRRVLCLSVIFEDHRMCALSVPASAVLLLFKHGGSLEPSPTQGGLIPPHGGGGVQHVCFAIPLASLDAWHTQLEKEHVLIESKVTQYFGGISLYFRDPDGHSIELATPGLWPNF